MMLLYILPMFSERYHAVSYFKSKNAGGYDEISTRILKLSAPYIISPLTYIWIAILNTGIFPDRLKYVIIKPIFKKR